MSLCLTRHHELIVAGAECKPLKRPGQCWKLFDIHASVDAELLEICEFIHVAWQGIPAALNKAENTESREGLNKLRSRSSLAAIVKFKCLQVLPAASTVLVIHHPIWVCRTTVAHDIQCYKPLGEQRPSSIFASTSGLHLVPGPQSSDSCMRCSLAARLAS